MSSFTPIITEEPRWTRFFVPSIPLALAIAIGRHHGAFSGNAWLCWALVSICTLGALALLVHFSHRLMLTRASISVSTLFGLSTRLYRVDALKSVTRHPRKGEQGLRATLHFRDGSQFLIHDALTGWPELCLYFQDHGLFAPPLVSQPSARSPRGWPDDWQKG